ncbi:hypothetical protein ABVT39_001492 [Epinephelus coioides]
MRREKDVKVESVKAWRKRKKKNRGEKRCNNFDNVAVSTRGLQDDCEKLDSTPTGVGKDHSDPDPEYVVLEEATYPNLDQEQDMDRGEIPEQKSEVSGPVDIENTAVAVLSVSEHVMEPEQPAPVIHSRAATDIESTKEGGEYSVASLRSLRAGINRHLRDVNIISDTVFKSSNAVFKAILKRYRKSGEDTSFHHPRIPESDLEIIRCSFALSPDTPLGLVRKVWFDIQLCLAWRGREGNRELTMASFSIQRDEDGVEYVSLAHNPDTKNHKDPNDPHKQNLRGFMFARSGDPLCPVKSFKKYISKCPPDAKSFYLHPKRSITVASDV